MNLKDYLNKINNNEEKSTALKAAVKAGKDKEFLAAEGVEISNELSDDELSAVAGGDKELYWDENGDLTHWEDSYGRIYHYECPLCRGVLHEGRFWLLYCDKCDDWFTFTAGDAIRVFDTNDILYK